MRLLPIVAASLMLTACGGHMNKAPNNGAANENSEGRPPTATQVSGDDAKKIMHQRHEGMKAIGKSNKAIRDQLQKSSPDSGIIDWNAAKIADLSQQASGWFPTGTGPEAGKTGAKAEIWRNPQDFTAKLVAFQKAVQALKAATSGNDLNAIRVRVDGMGQTCRACHDKYRLDMHHLGG
jgi:cytochrome c556